MSCYNHNFIYHFTIYSSKRFKFLDYNEPEKIAM
jgi:hypothetical protein